MSRAARSPRRLTAVIGAAALALTLAACTPDPVTEQYRQGSETGYIAGEFQVDEIDLADRGEPVVWESTTDTGEPLSSEDVLGDVVVVNFWYAGCAPCRVEAAHLEDVWQEYRDEGVSFVGVNTFDQPDQARSFAEKWGVTYPSVIDANDAAVKLAFAAATPIQATPVTLVLDREGRVAARIIGAIDSPSILSTLVADTLEEKA
ncbi:TlpA family protein disulfide reductase [Microbacterium paludicola]|uniref:TlpA family protein disulfide reductase n=1 Tax=Microbacterium paludicola TaxID=300019 RepID=UPI001F324FC6|nr:TlpA disulfide reductase family protein [Microbacterium paludicola]